MPLRVPRSGTSSSWRVGRDVKVHVYQDEVGEYRWQLRADNGEIIADSAEGNRYKGYCITMAQTVNPGAELVIDDKSEG
jgi:uncharacterized protein YegP (UPF0339 family)